jgi:hypothetical protein
MKADIKARWIEALRSGNYTQGFGKLRDGNKFCCLGVLCELAVADGIVSRSTNDDIHEYTGFIDGDSLLPDKVLEWIGAEAVAWAGGPILAIGGEQLPAYRHNDSRERTFAELADAIEAQVPVEVMA